MPISLKERVTLDAGKMRITGDGYLVAEPRVARTGIQLYSGDEVGRPDLKVVRVYRPEDSVFNKESMHTFAHRPVTDDHPTEPVTADNWKKLSVGQSGDDIARDGDFIRVPMVVMDKAVIDKVQAGKAELSVGYTCDLKWESGTSPKGEAYDAIQTNIRANHIAIVKAARGGAFLRIGDGGDWQPNKAAMEYASALIAADKIDRKSDWEFTAEDGKADHVILTRLAMRKDLDDELAYQLPFIKNGSVSESGLKVAKDEASKAGQKAVSDAADTLLTAILNRTHKGDKAMGDKTSKIGGITVTMTDQAFEVVERELAAKDAAFEKFKKEKEEEEDKAKKAKDALQKELDDAKKTIETKDAENATLKKQLEDAKLTPEKLDGFVKDRQEVIGKAKAVLGDKLVVDGKSTADIQRQVVDVKMGDAAKGWTEDQVTISFKSLTADVKPSAGSNVMDAARALSRGGGGAPADGAEKAYDAYNKRVNDAWKSPAPAAQQ